MGRIVHLRRQRRAGLRQGLQLDPGGLVPGPRDRGALDALLGAAAATNHNMLRIWGGGYYETETFYDLCDRYGILVWQDFMFACSVYPLTDPEFLANLEVEVREQVRAAAAPRLPGALVRQQRDGAGLDDLGLGPARERRSQGGLPALLLGDAARLGRGRATGPLPTGPARRPRGGRSRSRSAATAAMSTNGSSGTPWRRSRAYGHETYRFVSEFGFESLPAMATVAAFAPDPADWNMGSPMLDHHQRCPSGNARILYYMAQQFRLPKDFPSFVYLSQVLHAEAMRVGRRALAAAARPLQRRALLAAQRLLAGLVLGEHRLLRPLEGAAVRHAAVLRPGAALRRSGGRTGSRSR